MNVPLVYQLFRQEQRWVAMYGRDNRWKHLSGKPTWILDFPIRVVEDHHVDRLDVEVQQCMELTNTNNSIGLITIKRTEKSFILISFLVTIATDKHPIPSRTRPWKLLAPMVLYLKIWKSRSLPGLFFIYISSIKLIINCA